MGTKIFTPGNKLILLIYFNSNGEPRPMMMGTISTLWRYDKGPLANKATRT